MINDIEIFNVKFGDCFICKNKASSERMLIDFGSKQKITYSIINEVDFQLNNADKKYLMITHFHDDHYKGIKYLYNTIKFDEIYLPNFFSKDIIKLQYAILFALSPSNQSYTIANNLLSVIPDLLNHINNTTKIIFTRRGDRIINYIDTLRVLWPDNTDFDKRANRIYKDILDYYNIEEKRQIIEELVEEYFSTIPPVREDENQHRFIELNDNDISRLQSLVERMALSLGDYKTHSRRLGSRLSKEISSFQNSICICFDNAVNNNDKPVLFLSDISLDNYTKIYNNNDGIKMAEFYKVIKIPHHGTKDYYVNDLPNNDYLIVSNGRAPTNSWRITALYGWRYRTSKFICTNYFNACDYELASDKCDACKTTGCTCGISNNFKLNI